MAEYLVDEIICKSKEAATLYHRLVLFVAPADAGKTTTLQGVRDRTGAPLVNVSLELSRRMLELTRRQRAIQLPLLFREAVNHDTGETILLDNLEVLFDIGLQQDPLRLLQGLSRQKTLVAAWSGAIVDGSLTYAVPGHPEFRRYPAAEVLTVSPGDEPLKGIAATAREYVR